MKDERLKFGEKSKQPMKIDDDRLQVKEANFVEPVNVMIVIITKNHSSKVEDVNMLDYVEKVNVVCPNAEEELIVFLNHYKIKRSEVMLYPRCIVVFDKEVAKNLEGIRPHPLRKSFRGGRRHQFAFDKKEVPYQKHQGLSRS